MPVRGALDVAVQTKHLPDVAPRVLVSRVRRPTTQHQRTSLWRCLAGIRRGTPASLYAAFELATLVEVRENAQVATVVGGGLLGDLDHGDGRHLIDAGGGQHSHSPSVLPLKK